MSTTTSTGVTVVIVPPATANGPLHVGHLSGPYLAADIAGRAARARGERVVTTAGFDVHQNWVLTRAENEGVDVEKLAAAFREEIMAALDAARIRYDVFLNPQSPEYQRGVTALAADLTDAGRFPMRELTLLACSLCDRTLHQSYVVGECAWCGSEAAGGGCEGCGGYTSAENLINPRCNRCGGAPRPFTATVPVLPMEDYRQDLMEIWLRAELSERARQIVSHYLGHRLPDVPIAYPTNWGLAGTGPHEGLRLEVYAEVGLSNLYGVAQSLRPGAAGLAETRAAWSEVTALWHFNGIDNGFYFTLFWPAVYLAAGVPPAAIGGAQVNEFYTLDGEKFSTSRDHAIWANDFLSAEDVDVVRLYLAWDRPDRFASDFTLSSYREFEAYVRPLLDKAPGSASSDQAVPPAMAKAEVTRGLAALQPRGFDPALAVRAVLTGMAASAPGVEALLQILTGRCPMDAPDYDGRIFRPVGNPPGAPTGRYHQNGSLIWAEFGGGRLHFGRLVGTCDRSTGVITGAYCQLGVDGSVTAGSLTSTPGLDSSGVLTLTEDWHRLDGSTGISVIEEMDPSLAPPPPESLSG